MGSLAGLFERFAGFPVWSAIDSDNNVEWINTLAEQMWPFVEQYMRKFLKESVEPQIKAQIPSPFKSFQFEKISLGTQPPVLTALRTFTHNDIGYSEKIASDWYLTSKRPPSIPDQIVLDLDAVYAGDADIRVSIGIFNAGINEIRFRGHLRVCVRPLITDVPLAGGLAISFLEMPDLDFSLTGIGELANLPGLKGAIRGTITEQIEKMLVLPNEFPVLLSKNPVHEEQLKFPEPDGVVVIELVEAKNLEEKDGTFLLGKSDPYAKISVGSQTFKTGVIDDTNNPKFNETFQAVVDQATGQRLSLKLFDEDTFFEDDKMGWFWLSLADLREETAMEKWFPLYATKSGVVKLKLFWLDFGMNKTADLSRLPVSKPASLRPLALMVYIDSIANLTSEEAEAEGEESKVKMVVGDQEQETLPAPQNNNPNFKQKFFFFLTTEEIQSDLLIQVLNSEGDLGNASVSLRELADSEEMSLKQEYFTLTGPGISHSPKIRISARLRSLEPTVQDYEEVLLRRAVEEPMMSDQGKGPTSAEEPGNKPDKPKTTLITKIKKSSPFCCGD